jgi:large subunit ribosomal protein L23
MKQTDVIRRPLITEKTTLLRETGRTLVFEVAPHATKVDVKRAVEKLFGSKVESVRTALAHGKMKRQGRFVGQRSDWITPQLHKGQLRKTIDSGSWELGSWELSETGFYADQKI